MLSKRLLCVNMFTRQEKFILFVLAAIQFSHIVDFMIMMPLGPQLMRAFDMSAGQFAWLISSYTFAAGGSAFAGSFYLDRLDRKKALLYFNLGFSIGTILCAFAVTYEWLLVARFFTGAFGGVLSSLVFASVGDTIGVERRGTAMGIVMTAFSMASIFGVPFSLFLSNHFDWHAPFVVLGVFALSLTIFIFNFFPSMSAHLSRVSHHPLQTILGFVKEHRTRNVLFFMALLVLGHFMIIPFLSPALVANLDFPEKHLPYIYLVGGVVTIFSNPFYGRMTDRFGPRQVAMIAIPLSLFPILIITNLVRAPEALVYFIVGLFFLTMGGRIVPAQTLATSSVPPEQRGSFMSLVSCFQQLASAFAAMIAGSVIVKSSGGQLLFYSRLGLFSVVVGLAAWTLLYLFMGKRALQKHQVAQV